MKFLREWRMVYRRGGWFRLSALFYMLGLVVLPVGLTITTLLWSWVALTVGAVLTMGLCLVCMYAALASIATARSKEASDTFARFIADLNRGQQ